ncbi:MAG: hypothetical protein ISQ13_03215 [Candidatus Margulisbacteria bacterium]|nr:hypothetical protein [Candidatus Margulisiibacteriota bacterium]
MKIKQTWLPYGFAILLALMLPSMLLAFGTGNVSLKAKLMVALNGELVNRMDQSLDVKLVKINGAQRDVLWDKELAGVTIANGELNLNLQGEDRHGVALSAAMFDNDGVVLTIQLDGEEVALDMVSQPYAIKSTISDETHNARALQGIRVRLVDDVKDGDVLMIKDGEWVASGKEDGFTGISDDAERQNILSALDNVTIEGVDELNLLGFDGSGWRNVKDKQLTEADVRNILERKGYLKEVQMTAMAATTYPQITGIGGKISTDPGIEIQGQTMIQGGLILDGQMGSDAAPIPHAYVRKITVDGPENDVVIKEDADEVLVDSPIKIDERLGVAISATGKSSAIGVFRSSDELAYVPGLMWDKQLKQFWLGEVSPLDAIRMNVEGGFRVNGPFVLKDTPIEFDDYVQYSDLAAVATSGQYRDITESPDYTKHVLVTAFEDALALNYYNSDELSGKIEEKISRFANGATLQSALNDTLADYTTRTAANDRITATLSDYPAQQTMQDLFVDSSALTDTLRAYSTVPSLNADILVDYMLTRDVSEVGKSGSYTDILNWPNVVQKNAYNTDKQGFYDRYASKGELLEALANDFRANSIQAKNVITTDYVSKTQLKNELFVTQGVLDDLAIVAETGRYDDLLNTPDISAFMTESELNDALLDENELSSELIKYIQSSEVSAVAKTGRFDDFIDKPNMSEYMLVSDMGNYLKNDSFERELLTVQRTGNLPDLSGFQTTSDWLAILGDYTESETLQQVAFTGQYVDLVDEEAVVEDQELTQTLSDYATLEDLANERSQIDALYFDEAELTATLNEFTTDVKGTLSSTFTNQLYTKSEFNNQIAQKLETHRTTELIPDVNDAISDSRLKSTLNSQLQQNHVAESQVPAMVAARVTDRVTVSHYNAYNSTLATNPYFSAWFPRGMIAMWRGSTPPDGWVLCNATSQSNYPNEQIPDLSGRFIVSTGSGYTMGNTGGSTTLTITTENLPSHTHAAGSDDQLGEHSHTPTSGSVSNTHGHAGTTTTDGRDHGHLITDSSNQDTNHTHSGTAPANTNTHNHSFDEEPNHNHYRIYTNFGHEIGYSVLPGNYHHSAYVNLYKNDGGWYETSSAGHHSHFIYPDGAKHDHSVDVQHNDRVNDKIHSHDFTVDPGKATHGHPFSGFGNSKDKHNHTITVPAINSKHNHNISTTSSGGAGQSYTRDNRPPYYVLAFIMRL